MELSEKNELGVVLKPSTYFAPAAVMSEGELEELFQAVLDNEVVLAILDAVAGFAMVLSETRQILGVNRALAELLEQSDPVCFKGLRPGELLACLHAEAAPSGCGTGVACRSCGAVLSILAAQATSRPVDGECLLLYRSGESSAAKELRVRATPLKLGELSIVVLVLQDISAAKRKEALERVFLHDLQNSVTGLVGMGELAKEKASQEIVGQIVNLAVELGLEIRSQQMLLDAEQGRLKTNPTVQTCLGVFTRLEEQLGPRAARVSFSSSSPNSLVVSDQQLLLRVLLNMVTNALEADTGLERVTVCHEKNGMMHVFSVHNRAVIPPEVHSRIFHRTYSTKEGFGRGLGTYSMKLLGEQYLRGKVWFESNEGQGTTFYLSVPVEELAAEPEV